jgi:acetoin utilization protein AcuB
MRVRNWMQADPMTITSELLVSEAKRLLSENNLHALPVVEGGRLRGLVTRANVLRTGHFMLRTQNPAEFDYFVTRLKVRDIMVRNPATVQADDTMEHCLRKGQELGVAQFPVMEGERLVGVISANEIFQLAANCLGAGARRSGVTLAPVSLGPGVLGRIVGAAEAAGAVVQAVYPVGRHEAQKVIVRFHAADMGGVVCALQAAGFAVIESVEAERSALAA